jgi:hypothetical protein
MKGIEEMDACGPDGSSPLPAVRFRPRRVRWDAFAVRTIVPDMAFPVSVRLRIRVCGTK